MSLQITQTTIQKCFWKTGFTPKTIDYGDRSTEENVIMQENFWYFKIFILIKLEKKIDSFDKMIMCCAKQKKKKATSLILRQ